MNPQSAPLDVLRKIALLALLGFGVITLSGPLLAVFSVVFSLAAVILVFALVGLLVWFLFRTLYIGHRAAWQGVRELGGHAGGLLYSTGRGLGRMLVFPFRVVHGVIGGTLRAVGFLGKKTWIATRFVVEIALVALTGVLVGVIVGAITGAMNHDAETAIPANALVGGSIAAMAAIAMTFLEKKPALRQPG
jgi:hypothetical protein